MNIYTLQDKKSPFILQNEKMVRVIELTGSEMMQSNVYKFKEY